MTCGKSDQELWHALRDADNQWRASTTPESNAQAQSARAHGQEVYRDHLAIMPEVSITREGYSAAILCNGIMRHFPISQEGMEFGIEAIWDGAHEKPTIKLGVDGTDETQLSLIMDPWETAWPLGIKELAAMIAAKLRAL